MEKIKSNEQAAKLVLSKLTNKFKITYESGKIVFFIRSVSNSFYILLIGFIFFTLFALIRNALFLILSLISFSSYFIFKSKFPLYCYFYVIDYKNGIIYYDKRKGSVVSVSKTTMLHIKDILAVGVDNIVRYATEYEYADLIFTNQVFNSSLAFLCSDGKLFKKFQLINSNYEECCILAEALADLFGVPLLRCPRKSKLKVVKTSSGYRLDKENLKIDSVFTSLLKKIIVFIIICCVGAVICILYEYFK